ncbi:DUF6760 family protein [Rhodococcus rhodochrous]|uniref:DUF6760 family protein n=1 Tax=Rhodococcus rhodochrous TaxID=1829 RepID=UPI000FEFF04F
MTYGVDRLFEEVAYLAVHFHWSHDDLLDLEHADRTRYVALVPEMVGRTEARR